MCMMGQMVLIDVLKTELDWLVQLNQPVQLSLEPCPFQVELKCHQTTLKSTDQTI